MTDARWDLITEETQDRIERVARSLFETSTFEFEDLVSEAVILTATDASLIEALDSEDLNGTFEHRLRMDLTNLIDAGIRKTKRNVSYEVLFEESEDYLEKKLSEAQIDQMDRSPTYTTEMVEMLLPTVWDPTYAYGLPERADAPDPDMPRAKANPAVSNNLAAYLIDIKTGWEKADLTLKERRAIFLRYALDYTVEECGRHELCSHQAISVRIKGGLNKITDRLNNGIWYDLDQSHTESKGAA